MTPIIRTENLTVIYNLGKSSETPALKGINIEIYPEEYVIFFGPSGCGKSTLLYCLAGMETPTKGRVWVKGRYLDELTPSQLVQFHRSQIGMVFQAYYLIPSLSVLDNVVLPQIFEEVPPQEREKKALELLKQFGVYSQAHKYPSELSGGQQQRVAICRALINNPSIILADEPVGNLDSKTSHTVMELLNKLNKELKKTIILVTHSPDHLHYADRIFYMRDGQIIQESRKKEERSKEEPLFKIKDIFLDAQKLKAVYPNLSEPELKAKALIHYLMISFDEKEIKRLEKIIAQRIEGKINYSQLKELLDLPLEKGGVGLYTQTAQKLAQKIEMILSEAKLLEEKERETKETKDILDEKVIRLRRYLLDNYQGTLKKEEELVRLDYFIKLRIQRKITKEQFRKYLDLPFKKGGVGLNRKTAKKFANQLEMVLITKK